MAEETLTYDIIIVGAGPAGLAAAIRFKQLCQQHNKNYTIAVFDKAAEIGGHILSGAVMSPRALNELLPDWQQRNPPTMTPVTQDKFYYLTQHHALRLPMPSSLHNRGNTIVSLGQVCRWLGDIAQSLGVDLFPGFAVDKVIIEDNQVIGVKTGDKGLIKDGTPGQRFEPGFALRAKYTFLAEGCRGQLTEEIIEQFALRQPSENQTYGIGIKELWKIPDEQHQEGLVLHSIGWPLDKHTYGGSFVYHGRNNLVSLGFVIGLDYRNPYLDPFAECQRFKTHPLLQKMLAGGERIGYGARALNEGGWQSIPQCHFPGGAIIGCAAGFMNVAKIKGSHTAMKSGMLAAEEAFSALNSDNKQELTALTEKIKHSWVGQELYQARNIRPAFHRHSWVGLAYAALDQYILRGRAPWTFKHNIDHQQLQLASTATKPIYPKPDGKLTFDKLSSVYLTGTRHREDQPCHLVLREPALAISYNYAQFSSPEQYYCPANVYEIINVQGNPNPALQINASNCIHCKTCDIKDPLQNIHWVAPEGGEGPRYTNM